MRTNELSGAALDWAVAEAEGFFKDDMASVRNGVVDVFYFDEYSPSTDWAQGGAIIERERICLEDAAGMYWVATMQYQNDDYDLIYQAEEQGTTPLVAAMRCYVASCLGDEVQLPEELQ